MKIGCPKEIKNNEYRVGMTPAAVAEYVKYGHEVTVELDAGKGAGIDDKEYIAAGASIEASAEKIWLNSEMIIKVKEPLAAEYELMQEGQLVYTYFHLAASKLLTEACLARKITAVAYETVSEKDGSLPLLRPMSEVAGRMSALMGAYYLARPYGGRGVLPTGIPGVAPANVLVIGGGNVGINAAKVAAGLGAMVTVLDVNHARLSYIAEVMPANCVPVYSDSVSLAHGLINADIVIGAILLPGGAKAPKIITRQLLRTMKPGAVFADVAIDQGGIAETSRATTHDDPIFIEEGVVHYCVANMPGAYSRSSTFALNNVTTSYGVQLANKGITKAAAENEAILKGLNTYNGLITMKGVSEAFGMKDIYKAPNKVLGI